MMLGKNMHFFSQNKMNREIQNKIHIKRILNNLSKKNIENGKNYSLKKNL